MLQNRLLLLVGALCIAQMSMAQPISLAGKWAFQLDIQNKGFRNKWFNNSLKDTIQLPGSCEERGYGIPAPMKDPNRLTRAIRYEGIAWYQRVIHIPSNWNGKLIKLFLERCHWESSVWINGKSCGSQNSLSAPHVYDLGALSPGDYTLTIAMDNRYKLPIGTWGFAISDDTQGNWNGIIGKIELRASDRVHIARAQVFGDHVSITIVNRTAKLIAGRIDNLPISINPGSTTIDLPYKARRVWNEFDPRLDTLSLVLQAGKFRDVYSCNFGYRELATSKGQFTVNGRPAMMRGPVNECIYPLTGYPPMDVASWKRVLEICRSYGFNFMRFNSWCPPDAAFEAADALGVYLQVELPFWSLDAPEYGKHAPRDEYLKEELIRILDTYGNHPSFAFMAMGNESPGPFDRLVNIGRAHDYRHLYRCQDGDTITHGDYAERGTEIGQRGLKGPTTDWDRWTLTDDEATRHYQSSALPTIAHEVGQWSSYPDFDQLKKFTGNLRPYNYERFRESLTSQGMADQAKAFASASGSFALGLYKEEIEACLRTYPHGGFQVVEARDFTGEGTAIIGWLDAFWDSKGLIAPADFRQFCNSTVCLLRTDKRVYQEGDVLKARIQIAHYDSADFNAEVSWELKNMEGGIEKRGVFDRLEIRAGKVNNIGSFSIEFDKRNSATEFQLTVNAGTFRNTWKIWVYPSAPKMDSSNVVISYSYDEQTKKALREGKRVLLFSSPSKGLYEIQPAFMGPDSVRMFPPVTKGRSAIPGSFMPAFWSMRLFNQVGTLSLLCDPKHPLFTNFPTNGRSDWQWADLLGRFTALSSYETAGDSKQHDWGDVYNRSKSIILNETPSAYKPIVQMIDNYERNYKLGIIFETKVGLGKLLICAMDLDTDIDKRPAARQLKASLLDYAAGRSFNPEFEMSDDLLTRILTFE